MFSGQLFDFSKRRSRGDRVSATPIRRRRSGFATGTVVCRLHRWRKRAIDGDPQQGTPNPSRCRWKFAARPLTLPVVGLHAGSTARITLAPPLRRVRHHSFSVSSFAGHLPIGPSVPGSPLAACPSATRRTDPSCPPSRGCLPRWRSTGSRECWSAPCPCTRYRSRAASGCATARRICGRLTSPAGSTQRRCQPTSYGSVVTVSLHVRHRHRHDRERQRLVDVVAHVDIGCTLPCTR